MNFLEIFLIIIVFLVILFIYNKYMEKTCVIEQQNKQNFITKTNNQDINWTIYSDKGNLCITNPYIQQNITLAPTTSPVVVTTPTPTTTSVVVTPTTTTQAVVTPPTTTQAVVTPTTTSVVVTPSPTTTQSVVTKATTPTTTKAIVVAPIQSQTINTDTKSYKTISALLGE